jgi:hypothetical protein
LRQQALYDAMSLQPRDMKKLRAGDEAAWQEAFRALWPAALHAARHTAAALNVEDAQEVASDALAHLVLLVSKAPSMAELKALVVAMAYRRAILSSAPQFGG